MKHEKTISLNIWTLSWPICIEVFLQILVGNIDQIMMSHYSQEAVAAVANANQILNVFIMLIVVMSTATTILIAQYLGARNKLKLGETCTVSLAFSFVFSSLAALGFILFNKTIFSWLGVPPETMDETVLYTTIVGAGPIPSLGVLGVSISTWLSKLIGLGLIVWLFRKLLDLDVGWKYLHPFPWETLKGLLRISIPSGGETLSYQLSQTTIMKMVNLLGLAVINTKVYVYIIAMLCYVYTIALSNASQVIVGYLMGAQEQAQVAKRVWQSTGLAVVISVSLATFFYLVSEPLISLVTTDPEVIHLAHGVLLVEIFLEVGRAVNIVMVGCLQAAGDIKTPMLVGIFGMWCCAVPGSYLLGIHLGWGLVGIWVAMAADEIVRAIIFVFRWQSGKWKNKKLIKGKDVACE